MTEEQLHRAGEIPTDLGETLSWPYLCWVREHPLHWHGRTQVLYGDRDALTSRTMIERFRQESGAHLTIMEGGGTLVPHPSADGCCANVGRSKPLIFKTIANKNAADGFSSVSGILPILLRDAPI